MKISFQFYEINGTDVSETRKFELHRAVNYLTKHLVRQHIVLLIQIRGKKIFCLINTTIK